MEPKGRGPTSETRIAVAGDQLSIEAALAQAEAHVGRMAPSPSTEHLKSSLQAFRRTFESWDSAAPTEAELRCLREQVTSVLQLAKTTSPTVRIRRLG